MQFVCNVCTIGGWRMSRQGNEFPRDNGSISIVYRENVLPTSRYVSLPNQPTIISIFQQVMSPAWTLCQSASRQYSPAVLVAFSPRFCTSRLHRIPALAFWASTFEPHRVATTSPNDRTNRHVRSGRPTHCPKRPIVENDMRAFLTTESVVKLLRKEEITVSSDTVA
jgi:hypothetical protein